MLMYAFVFIVSVFYEILSVSWARAANSTSPLRIALISMIIGLLSGVSIHEIAKGWAAVPFVAFGWGVGAYITVKLANKKTNAH